MVEALLLGLVAFIAQSEYALGTSLISRPIVTGLLTGLVLGMCRPASSWARR
jgi:fructoselysine and glucoselysine-specific PTS system IIC component